MPFLTPVAASVPGPLWCREVQETAAAAAGSMLFCLFQNSSQVI